MSSERKHPIPLALLAVFAAHCASIPPRPTPFVPNAAVATDKAALLAIKPELDAFFDDKFSNAQPTGSAVGIVLDGELVYARTFGVLQAGAGRAVDPNSLFRLASVTKSFVALAVLRLRDAGKLSLDAPLTGYLPELANLRAPTRDAPALTARMLLTHTSGLPWDDTWGPVSFGMNAGQLNALLQGPVGFARTPGGEWEYSNLDYALLGRLVERVSGMGYRDYIRREIFAPLGIQHAAWASEVAARAPDNLALGYWEDAGVAVPVPPTSDGVFEPAGGLYMSLAELARYAAFHLAAYPPRDAPEVGPVRRSSLREMHQAQQLAIQGDQPVVERTPEGTSLWLHAYGFGWAHVTTCSEERVQHGGWEPGYFSGITLLPKHRLGIITFATGHALGPTTIPLLALLRSKNALPKAWEPNPSEALVSAQRGSLELLAHWDDGRAQNIFDPGAIHYPWFRALPTQFAEISQAHGRCEADGSLHALSRLHGKFRARCERGALELDVSLAPSPTAGITLLQLERILPADARMRATAERVLRGGAGLEAEADPLRKVLAGIALEHRDCVLGDSTRGDGHAQALFSLQCAETPLELELGLDDAGKLTRLDVHAPRAAAALCR